MRIIYWTIKWAVLLGSLGGTFPSWADRPIDRQVTTEGLAQLHMNDGSRYEIRVPPETQFVFIDRRKHRLRKHDYVAVYAQSSSSSGQPLGLCGAGREIELKVYRIDGRALEAVRDVKVESCLESVYLASQNTGEPDQENNFSSVHWDEHGFSVRWLSRFDSAGKPLESTRYEFEGAGFEVREQHYKNTNERSDT